MSNPTDLSPAPVETSAPAPVTVPVTANAAPAGNTPAPQAGSTVLAPRQAPGPTAEEMVSAEELAAVNALFPDAGSTTDGFLDQIKTLGMDKNFQKKVRTESANRKQKATEAETEHPELADQIILEAEHPTEEEPTPEPEVTPEPESVAPDPVPTPEPKSDDDEPEPTPGNIPQIRYRPKDDFDRKAIQMAKTLGISLEQAIAEVKRISGENPALQPQAPDTQLADIDKEITETRTAYIEAKRAFDVDKEVEAQEKLQELRDKKSSVIAKQRNAQQSAQDQHTVAVQRNVDEMIARYPELSDVRSDAPKNALSIEAHKVMRELQAENDPSLSSTKFPKLVVQEAVARLQARGVHVTVNNGKPATTPVKPAPVQKQPAKTPPPMAGTSPRSTSAPTTASTVEQAEALWAALSTDDIREATRVAAKRFATAR